MLKDKKILLCVTGGIAAYKACDLTSKLVQEGAKVKVAMSESATKFVNPLSFQALSRNEVYLDTFTENNPKVISHIALAEEADLVLIAPATANTIAKIATGQADNFITATILATTAPVYVAPAMNKHMYAHPAVQKNIASLRSFNYKIIQPEAGFLACGQVGPGRLAQVEEIIENIKEHFQPKEALLSGQKVLVTAGPTREKIDPVRFLTNFSSGKMGYAIAKQAEKLGAEVVLISGPSQLPAPEGVSVINVESAAEMYEAVISNFEDAQLVIKTAAVADYRPVEVLNEKLKKSSDSLTLQLEKTIDILAELGKRKRSQILLGFAAETNDLEANALKKLKGKNADFIVANDITDEGAGFNTDTNKVTIYKAKGDHLALPLMSKDEVALRILQEVTKQLKDDQ